VGEEHVLRFEIPVNDVLGVRRVQGAGNVAQNRQGLLDGNRPGDLQVTVQRLPVEELHHVVVAAVLELAERKDVDDVAVADLVDRTGFGLKPRHHLRVGRVLPGQHLDGDLFADERMGRAKDGAKPALADLAVDNVLADFPAWCQIDVVRPDVRDLRILCFHLVPLVARIVGGPRQSPASIVIRGPGPVKNDPGASPTVAIVPDGACQRR